MEMQQNNDFKYVIQDTNCVYFGRELTYADMMEKDDIPFKFKAVINSHIARDIDLNSKMTDHLLQISEEEFSYRIFDQLKLTVRVCYKVRKKDRRQDDRQMDPQVLSAQAVLQRVPHAGGRR